MTAIVALTLNPSIDISTSVDRLAPVKKLRCASPQFYPGGGGVNVARVAVRLGAEAQLIYPTGGATGQLLRRLVDAEGIPNLAIDLAEETREDFTVLEESTGDEYRFVFPGPRLSTVEWRKCLAVLESMQVRPAYIVASGSLPPGVPEDFYALIARIAREWRSRFVIDTSGKALANALKEGVFLVKPNLRELKEFSGFGDESDESVLAASREIVRRGMAEVVAVTLGDHGAILATRHDAWRASGPDVQAVSAVGAGDSFLGGLLSALATGKEWPEALRDAVAAGAAAVLTPGTALAHRGDIERLHPLIEIRPIYGDGTGRMAAGSPA